METIRTRALIGLSLLVTSHLGQIGKIIGQNRRSENRRLPEWPIAKTADDSLGPPEINLPIPLISVIELCILHVSSVINILIKYSVFRYMFLFKSEC